MRNPLNPSQTKRLFQSALGGFWLTIFAGTHVPLDTPLLPEDIANVDKIYHFTAYAILAGLMAATWQVSSGRLTGRHLRWVWMAAAIYGALDETTQLAVNRDCSIWDWFADATGAAVGLLVFVWLRKRFAATPESQ